ncbi:copper-containing nitrite reductase [Halobaculum gomorrense]|uniref:Copper-containing nitrite reductase n=1 Tax=Halobaculum gomorrense TaxID=43928 RepID=A0A1M5PP58_9EURY|nr:copper-containing nitrite reductase [Halobaculum gomorrense]SHH03557.1 dissimilatory nitrite reductase (NO-forming), copper type apoprotein [Halobaculum gomorrense]
MPTTRRTTLKALGTGAGGAALAGCSANAPTAEQTETARETTERTSGKPTARRVAADPTDIPDPIDRDTSKTVQVELTAKEVRAEIEPGVVFDYMTFDGQIPGPMVRVRQGDTVEFSLTNASSNAMPHNVDFHAVYGTGGGNVATTAAPGTENGMRFEARYPGAFIYHCAVPNLDYHISSGMFGMILVEPKEGLPAVDREFYFGQHEVYTDKPAGEKGRHSFDIDAMKAEDPTYVLLNGQKYAITPDNLGAVTAETGETVRVFMVDGGPNLNSNFHPIGNVWTEAYRDGGLAGRPERYLQTVNVPPGSCMVGTLDLPVPEHIKLVDHALSRVARKGMMGVISVEGEEKPGVFDPSPNAAPAEDEEGPAY